MREEDCDAFLDMLRLPVGQACFARFARTDETWNLDEWDFVHPAALKLEGDAILAGLATDPEDVEAMEEAARRRARLCACWPG